MLEAYVGRSHIGLDLGACATTIVDQIICMVQTSDLMNLESANLNYFVTHRTL